MYKFTFFWTIFIKSYEEFTFSYHFDYLSQLSCPSPSDIVWGLSCSEENLLEMHWKLPCQSQSWQTQSYHTYETVCIIQWYAAFNLHETSL